MTSARETFCVGAGVEETVWGKKPTARRHSDSAAEGREEGEAAHAAVRQLKA
jgi:hypothetical protein